MILHVNQSLALKLEPLFSKAISRLLKKGIFDPLEIKKALKSAYRSYEKRCHLILKGDAVFSYDEIIAAHLQEIETIIKNYPTEFKERSMPFKKFVEWKKKTLARTANGTSYHNVAKTYTLGVGYEYFEWMVSSSVNLREYHEDHVGYVYKISEGANGDYPAVLPNCKCGMRILSNKEALELLALE